jgi:hypothetical protein
MIKKSGFSYPMPCLENIDLYRNIYSSNSQNKKHININFQKGLYSIISVAYLHLLLKTFRYYFQYICKPKPVIYTNFMSPALYKVYFNHLLYVAVLSFESIFIAMVTRPFDKNIRVKSNHFTLTNRMWQIYLGGI